MRIRALFAIAILLLPSAVSAQRIPIPTRRGPARPTPLPPQPPTITRELGYRRLPYSIETYPLISRVVSPGFVNGTPSWMSGGLGTHADLKVTPVVSVTLDITSSFLGGPIASQTAEFGTRLRPRYSESRLYPFVDARVGYVYAYHNQFRPLYDPYMSPMSDGFGYVGRYSQGIGAIAGGGVDFALTRRFFLTTGAAVTRSHMWVQGFQNVTPDRNTFGMTSYRFTLGVRYNPVRVLAPRGPLDP
jgi:hypothetical protein